MQKVDTPEQIQGTPKPETKKAYSRQRVYWYLAAIAVEYVEEVELPSGPTKITRTKHMNAIVQSAERTILARMLEDVRNMVFIRAREQYGINPDSVSDYIITNMIFMGHMSEHEHFTKLQEK